MGMTEVFEKLESLQDVLAEKYDCESKIAETPKQLGSQEELLARLRKEFLEKNTVYEQVKKDVEELKKELSNAEASRESGEKNMDSVSTHREFEALEKQISDATEKENSVRRDLQKKEKELNELNDQLELDENMIKSQEEELSASKAAVEKEVSEYKEKLESLETQRKELVESLGNDEIIDKFERIIRRNREGFVAVKNGVCTGCHMILPAQFANEVREGEKILFCPYCSRILFYQEAAEGEEQDYFSMDETGTLADLDDEFADEYEESDEMENDEDSADGEKPLSFEE